MASALDCRSNILWFKPVARVIALCFWARHTTLTASLSGAGTGAGHYSKHAAELGISCQRVVDIDHLT